MSAHPRDSPLSLSLKTSFSRRTNIESIAGEPASVPQNENVAAQRKPSASRCVRSIRLSSSAAMGTGPLSGRANSRAAVGNTRTTCLAYAQGSGWVPTLKVTFSWVRREPAEGLVTERKGAAVGGAGHKHGVRV